MSYAYNPYIGYTRTPSALSYPSAYPSTSLSTYADSWYPTRELPMSLISGGIPTRSYESRYHRRARNSWYSREPLTSQVSDRMPYNFFLNGKPTKSNENQDYRLRRARESRYSTRPLSTSQVSDRVYFDLKNEPSHTIRRYKRAQDSWYSPRALQSQVSDRMYDLKIKLARFYKTRKYRRQVPKICVIFNGKLVMSRKIRGYRRAQRHVLKLFPEALRGIASSRIQFYQIRAKYHRGRYINYRSNISKSAWKAEIDSLTGLPLYIDVRESVSVTESVFSFFNRARFISF